jgi:hypothetical protein
LLKLEVEDSDDEGFFKGDAKTNGVDLLLCCSCFIVVLLAAAANWILTSEVFVNRA